MLTWWLVLAAYFALGLSTTWMASVGHKSKYGTSLGWPLWVAGPIGWPIILLVALRRK